MSEATVIAVLGLAGTLLGGIGAAIAAAARVALRAVTHRVETLEAEVRGLRSDAAARDALAVQHSEWDAEVRVELRGLGRDPGPPPPLLPVNLTHHATGRPT